MPNLRPLPSLESLLANRPVMPSRPVVLSPLPTMTPLKPAPLQPAPQKPATQPATQPSLKSPQAMAVDNLWNLQAALNVLKADTNGDGSLNADEYKSISLVQGDSYFASNARDYEFAAVDEVKFSDGKVTMGELAGFYQQMDTDKSGSHSQAEFEARLNQTSWLTKLRNPVASFSQAISHYTNLVKSFATGT